jgi:CubicO group peptidase (beta-lactamase class C family)
VKAGDDWFLGSAAGIRSCVRDLQKLYHAFIICYNDQTTTGRTSTPGLPLRQVATPMSPQIVIDSSDPQATYGLGWAIARTPCRFGYIGLNPGLMADGMPVIGKGAPPRLVMYHQGSWTGALALTMLLPETSTFLVILSNFLALNDVPDWIGQLVLEELLGVSQDERVDFVSAAVAAREKNLEWYPSLVRKLKAAKNSNTSSRELSRYVGNVWDAPHMFKIVVMQEGDDLYQALQGLESEKFRLSHYHDDTFI